MLMNQCLALIVTIVVFVTGINHVTNVLVCRSVGVLLHYFLLCTLLWVGCSGICLHRLIRTAIEPEEYNPVLRYYMMSWGRFIHPVFYINELELAILRNEVSNYTLHVGCRHNRAIWS